MRLPLRVRLWFARWLRPKPLGQRGEAFAVRYLKRKGYKIVARGARNRISELDVVAVDGRTVVFVEVKTRASHDAGHPAEAITPDKQRRLTRAALSFMKRHGLMECSCRFDVIALTWPPGARRPAVEHIVNAFEATGRGQMFS